MLTLQLKRVDVAGIYGQPPKLPDRMRLLHPAAADAVVRVQQLLGGRLICSDMLRTMEAQLAARKEKRGVQVPGYSAHHFGLAFDLDVDGTLAALKIKAGYTGLCRVLEKEGWYCHRRDGALDRPEWWHFNYLGSDASDCLGRTAERRPASWERAVEHKIQLHYGEQLRMDLREAQTALAGLRLYSGDVDEEWGPLSRAALTAFRRSWEIPPAPDGELLDLRTQRTLAVLTAERQVTG